MLHMQESTHSCDNCGKTIDRHVFCTIGCSKAFHNGHRGGVKKVAPKLETQDTTKDDSSLARKIVQLDKPVFHCKKHFGALSIHCGCND